MARLTMPETGVFLNPVLVERISLTFDEAVTAWLLRMRGEKYNKIAHMLGCNPARLGEVFRGEVHPPAREKAMWIIRAT